MKCAIPFSRALSPRAGLETDQGGYRPGAVEGERAVIRRPLSKFTLIPAAVSSYFTWTHKDRTRERTRIFQLGGARSTSQLLPPQGDRM